MCLRKSADGLVVGFKHRFDRRAPRRACHGGERVGCASLAALERRRSTHAPTSTRPAVDRGRRRSHFSDTQATAGAHKAPPADLPTTTRCSAANAGTLVRDNDGARTLPRNSIVHWQLGLSRLQLFTRLVVALDADRFACARARPRAKKLRQRQPLAERTSSSVSCRLRKLLWQNSSATRSRAAAARRAAAQTSRTDARYCPRR